jgi:branched-chain amino acid transport system substrate-binding protein
MPLAPWLARCALAAALWPGAAAAAPAPVFVGLDLEMGVKASTSGQAVQLGVEIAIQEINAAGGVLGGRPLRAIVLDNRSVPARGAENVRELARQPDLVAVFCGRFSTVVLEEVPLLHDLELPLLDPWAAADAIVDNGFSPNYAFRLSMRDDWAAAAMLRAAQRRGLRRVALLLPNTGWGRSNEAAMMAHLAAHGGPDVTDVQWHNWGATTLVEDYQHLRQGGAQAILMVTNEQDGALLVRQVAALPPEERLPLIAHHGIVGGDFAGLAGPGLQKVDLTVVQFFGFREAKGPRAAHLLRAVQKATGSAGAGGITSAPAIAAAYDLTHILARAVDLAGTTRRPAVRRALEEVRGYDGAVKRFARPFTAGRHEALTPADLYLARYDERGELVRVR